MTSRSDARTAGRHRHEASALALLSLLTLHSALSTRAGASDAFARASAIAQERVVKLYGAAIGREKAYGSGVVISPDGQIVTALSVLLEGRSLRAVLPDGRALPAQILARDERRQLALLKVDAAHLPYFELPGSPGGKQSERGSATDRPEAGPPATNRSAVGHPAEAGIEAGDWVIAAANPFNVAEGPEPVSISVGVLAGRVNLAARHRAQDFPYEGPVLLTDIIVTAPGSAGGALLDLDGRLVGVIGRPVISRYTNTWVNFAVPVEEVAAFVASAQPALAGGDARAAEGQKVATGTATAPAGDSGTMQPAAGADSAREVELGIQLFDVGGRVRPAYVERVRPGSPAARAGLRANDLIVSLDGQPVASCEDFARLVSRLQPGRPVSLVVKRGDELKPLDLAPANP